MRHIADGDTINDLFSYHLPHADQIDRFKSIRDKAWALALTIVTYTPESPERDVAISKLQEAVMWANAAIAINEQHPDHVLPTPRPPAAGHL